ncbi:MAG TPA: hypothetical protein VIS29_23540 [Streptomyces sp.]
MQVTLPHVGSPRPYSTGTGSSQRPSGYDLLELATVYRTMLVGHPWASELAGRFLAVPEGR